MGLRHHLRKWNKELIQEHCDVDRRKERDCSYEIKRYLKSTAAKYDEAVRLYETTTESLKSIARRLGLPYNSVGGFVRRSRPDAIAAHNCLLKQEERIREQKENLRCEKEQAESADLMLKKEIEEKERLLLALKQSGGCKRDAAKLLGIGKSTLYNKLKAYGLGK